MCDGNSSNHRPYMWHFSLRATMSLHILRFESVRLLLTCCLIQCGYTSSSSQRALMALTGTNYLSLRSVTYVLRDVLRPPVSVLPHIHPSRVLQQQYILLCFATYVFLKLSHSLCFTGQLSVLQRSNDNSGHSIKVTYWLRRYFK
jgi:hypothetical protein